MQGNQTGSSQAFFLSVSHADMCKLADKLSQHLTIEQGERLAEHLLAGVVVGSGKLAVESSIRLQGKVMNGARSLAELLQMWKNRLPCASVYLLRSAIASFHQSTAATTVFRILRLKPLLKPLK